MFPTTASRFRISSLHIFLFSLLDALFVMTPKTYSSTNVHASQKHLLYVCHVVTSARPSLPCQPLRLPLLSSTRVRTILHAFILIPCICSFASASCIFQFAVIINLHSMFHIHPRQAQAQASIASSSAFQCSQFTPPFLLDTCARHACQFRPYTTA